MILSRLVGGLKWPGELLLRRKRLNSVRWGHVVACLISPFIGLGRRYFGYYLVTAQKR